jgi:hypothetical protein
VAAAGLIAVVSDPVGGGVSRAMGVASCELMGDS